MIKKQKTKKQRRKIWIPKTTQIGGAQRGARKIVLETTGSLLIGMYLLTVNLNKLYLSHQNLTFNLMGISLFSPKFKICFPRKCIFSYPLTLHPIRKNWRNKLNFKIFVHPWLSISRNTTEMLNLLLSFSYLYYFYIGSYFFALE